MVSLLIYVGRLCLCLRLGFVCACLHVMSERRRKQVTQLSQRYRAAGRGLEATYAVVHLRLIGKPVVDVLLVIIEHFR